PAGAFFCADRSLDQFDVSITPFLQSLIEIGHQFEQDRALGRILVEAKDFLLYTLVWAIRLRDVTVLELCGNLCPASGKKIIEMVDDTAFVQQLLQAIVAGKVRL